MAPLPHTHTVHQDADGKVRDAWGATAIRLTELALTPDFKHLVAVGMEWLSNPPPATEATQSRGVQAGEPSSTPPGGNTAPVRMIVFDFATKQTESCVVLFSSSLMPRGVFC